MNLFAFTVAATCAATGQLRVDWRRLAVFMGVSLAIVAAVLIGLRTALSAFLGEGDIPRRTLMNLTIENPAPVVFRFEAPRLPTVASTDQNRIQQILERGSLRVGYNADNLPFAFVNEEGDLVGFDIELMHEMAQQLGVKLELVPWTYETLFDQLDRGDFDVTAGGMVVNLKRLARASFSEPYMEVTAALVVPDHLRNEIESWRQIDEELIMRVGVTGHARTHKVRQRLSNTDIKPVKSYDEFFTDNPLGVDAILISAEAGSAWTVLYPEYAVVVPEPQIKTTVALLLPKGDPDFRDLVAEWIKLKKADKTIDRLYEKWILGKDDESKNPRWSVARNVLGWE
jgi:ABC-type amino acid transport substrate-binding protein